MIRWMFYFDEGHIASEVTEEDEDSRIADFIENLNFFEVKGKPVDFYINPEKLRLASREVVESKPDAT